MLKNVNTAFEILAALSFCHLLNDMMQSLIPAIYPILKENFRSISRRSASSRSCCS